MPLTQTGRLLSVTTSAGADAFLLTAFRGREELSRGFQFTLDLVSDDATHKPKDFVGQPVGWAVNDPEATPRLFHGVVRTFTAGPVVGRGLREYRADVVPWTWLLSRAVDCCSYQAKTAVEIVEAVFGKYGFSDFSKSVTAAPPAREFCVQYQETALAFVSRLLEDEGIFTTFTYAAAKHTLVLADAPSAYAACDPHATVEYRPEAPGKVAAVTAWERGSAFVTGKTATTDYHFITPTTALLATVSTVAPVAKMKSFERFDFPGTHVTKARGDALAKLRIEEEEAGYDTAAGASGCSSFRPGAKFTLSDHPADDGDYAFTAVEHSATDPNVPGISVGAVTYANTFTCIPATVPARPARLTPKPRTAGPVTAKVVGPAGEEIHPDEYGRVKVLFPWDRVNPADDTASCWLRVSDPWAGAGWGAQFLPRVGTEVVVDFLHGDPDRPIVTGRVVNADHMRPYALPAKKTQSGFKTRSTPNGGEEDFNELRFEDKKGEEDVYVHAQKDMHRVVENDDDLKVGHDQTIEVKNARTVFVREADDKLTVDKGARFVTVSKGKDVHDVTEGDRLVTVGKGDDTHTVSKGHRIVGVDTGDSKLTVKTGNRLVSVDTGNSSLFVKTGNRVVNVDTGNDTVTVKVGNHTTKASAGKVLIEAAMGITLKVGGSEISIEPAGITIKGLKVEVKADVQAKVSGVMTEIGGDAMCKVKGGIVMIN